MKYPGRGAYVRTEEAVDKKSEKEAQQNLSVRAEKKSERMFHLDG
jgi:predicted RNA-binding protein YlxR (DUF448 family)